MSPSPESLPNADFFNFEVYHLPEHATWEVPESSRAVVVVAKNASAADLELLGKIMAAVGLNLKTDVHLLNVPTTPSFETLLNHLDCQQCLVFGFEPEALYLQINWPPYQLLSFRQCQLLRADSLAQIGAQPMLKKQLWQQLQQLFPR